MIKYLIALLLTVSLSASAWADALQSMEAFTKSARTVSGNFSQAVYDRNHRKTQEATGEMFFSRPDKFRWVYEKPYRQLIVGDGKTVWFYEKPYKQLIVGDGKTVWFYDADLAQVTKRRMDQAVGETPAALLAGSNDIDKYFDLKDAGQRDGLDWLEATPKNKAGTFEKVELGFRGNELQAMELKDNFGQTTLLKFNGLKTNIELKDDIFHFVPPKGVDVLDGT